MIVVVCRPPPNIKRKQHSELRKWHILVDSGARIDRHRLRRSKKKKLNLLLGRSAFIYSFIGTRRADHELAIAIYLVSHQMANFTLHFNVHGAWPHRQVYDDDALSNESGKRFTDAPYMLAAVGRISFAFCIKIMR